MMPATAAELAVWAEPRNTAGIPFTLHAMNKSFKRQGLAGLINSELHPTNTRN